MERKRGDFTDKNTILSKLLQIPGGKIKPLAELNAKDIYNVFLLRKKVYTNSQSYLSSKFPNIEIDWNICFKCNFVNPLLSRKCKDFNWKIFYGLVNMEVRLKRMKKINWLLLYMQEWWWESWTLAVFLQWNNVSME